MRKAKRMKEKNRNTRKEDTKTSRDNVRKEVNNKKKVIIAILIIILIALIVVGIKYIIFNLNDSKEEIDTDTQNNEVTPENLEEEAVSEKRINISREYRSMRIQNIQVYEEMGNMYFKAEIENTSGETFEKRNVTIAFVNEERESIVEYRKHIEEIQPGEILEIQLIGDSRIEQAYDFRIIEE